MLLQEPIFAFAPHVGVSIPAMDYEERGFAAVGRGLNQLHLGASIGRTLDPWLPNLYLHVSYEFSIVEKYDATPETEEIDQNRQDLSFQLGYAFLDGKLELNVGLNYRVAQDGLNFTDFSMYSADLRMYHDPLMKEDFLSAGGGAGYEISETLRVNALIRFFIQGYNTRDNDIIALGLTWSPL
jgi:hypothetical protein